MRYICKYLVDCKLRCTQRNSLYVAMVWLIYVYGMDEHIEADT